MRQRILPAMVALAAGLAACVTAEAQHDCCDGCGQCGKGAAALARLRGGEQVQDEGLEGVQEALGDTDLLDVNMEIEVFPGTGTGGAGTTIAGTSTMTVRVVAPSVTQFTIRLRENFAASATMGGLPVTMTRASATTKVITLNRAYTQNETFAVRISWSGTPVSRGLGSWYTDLQSGQPIIGTLSEPYYAYTWCPSKEGDTFEAGDNSDKATYQIAIIAPTALTAVSNGLLLGTDTLPGNRRRARWGTTYPMAPYLACFSVSQYTRWTQSYPHPGAPNGVMPIEYYIYTAQDTPARRASWEVTRAAMDVYGDLFGLYPFPQEKYGIYQFPFNGGMEHQTMTGMGTFSESVTVHELAHHWFGNDVTCRTWSDIWLNEGFATYCEALWFERKPGSTGLPALHAAMAARRPSAFTGTVYLADPSDPVRVFSSNYSYRKGGWVLHMLRKMVGETAFFDGLRDHLALHPLGAATTEQFKATMIAASGQDLNQFFNEWVYGPGAPDYDYASQAFEVNGRPYAAVTVRQVQATPANASVYTMPMDVQIPTAAGLHTVNVKNDAREETFVIALPAPMTGAPLIDPENWILAVSKDTVAFGTLPTVLLESSPSPGSALAEAPGTIELWFSTPISAAPSAFVLSGPSGAVGLGVTLIDGGQRALLTPAVALTAGSYSLVVGPGITGTTALDGEITLGQLP
ncbi:MAG: M1 family aminopeptidase, partial [Phycisphaerales bacterium]